MRSGALWGAVVTLLVVIGAVWVVAEIAELAIHAAVWGVGLLIVAALAVMAVAAGRRLV